MHFTSRKPVLIFDFVINTCLTVIEYAAAFMSGSAALMADATQNLTDSLVITVSYWCEQAVKRPHLKTLKKRAIYRRAGITNSLILLSLAAFIAYHAYDRLLHPRDINGMLVIGVGLLSIGVNFGAAWLLARFQRYRNLQAPYVGLIFSGLSGIGVMASGLAIQLWHIHAIDGIIGLVIAGMLCVRSLKLLVAFTAHL